MVLFLFLDFFRPLHFALTAELLFIGIIFVSLHFALTYSLVFCAVFGILKDSFSSSFFLFHTTCFILFTVIINYVRTQFHAKRALKTAVVVLSIAAYAILNSIAFSAFDFWLMFSFCLQSFLLFYVVDYFLMPWVRGLSHD